MSYRIGSKKDHELPLLRQQWDSFKPGDIFPGDKGSCSFYDVCKFQDRGADSVITLARRTPVGAMSAMSHHQTSGWGSLQTSESQPRRGERGRTVSGRVCGGYGKQPLQTMESPGVRELDAPSGQASRNSQGGGGVRPLVRINAGTFGIDLYLHPFSTLRLISIPALCAQNAPTCLTEGGEMKNVSCVIANSSQQMLADIVENTVKESGFIDVVEQVNDTMEIAAVVARTKADVLILGVESHEFVKVCAEVMDQIADILVIGLVDDGRRLAVVLENASSSDIPNIIRTLRGGELLR